jgi:hypothetical protein
VSRARTLVFLAASVLGAVVGVAAGLAVANVVL